MKTKLISLCIMLTFLFTSILSVDAIAASPRIDLDEYQIITTDINNIYVNGTVSIGVGQLIGLYDSSGKILYAYTQVNNSNLTESFRLQIPSRYLKSGANTFKVKSLPIKNMINGSNHKTLTVNINSSSKKDQIITANNLELKINEKKNINASVNSGLCLTYLVKDISIATVDQSGNVIGRKAGTTTVEISQAGNNQYNSVKKTITITVKNNTTSTPMTKQSQTISTNFNSWQFYDKSSKNTTYKITLKAKASSGLKVTWKSSNKKIATINSKGIITAKKPGTVKIILTQSGNSKYKPVTKNITIKVPKKKSRKSALKPWYNAMRIQANIQNKNMASYNWPAWDNSGCTLKASEYYGTCITFPSASLMRIGLLNNGEWLSPQDGDSWNSYHKNASIRRMNSHPGYFSYYDHFGTLKSGVDSGKILPGDIIHYSYHTLVFEEKKDGKYYISDAGHNGTRNRNYAIIHHAISGNEYVGWINRINCYDVNTACKDGTITISNKYMAGRNVKVTYKPNKGKKIQSIRVDGKELSKSQIKKYKNSYTFTKLNKNHYITVRFG